MTDQTLGRRWLRRFTTGTTTAGLLLLAVPPTVDQASDEKAPREATSAAPVQLVGHHKPHPHRKIKRYRVRPGDTPSSIAVRYHAWTAQLIRINHSSTLYVGDVILVPVVRKASRACTKHRHHRTGLTSRKASTSAHHPAKHKPKRHHHATKPKTHKPKAHQHRRHRWVNADATRAEVRRVITRKARRMDVNSNLALAISWQESGWQHHRVSSAGAIGAMQVMPSTGRWMSLMVGRKLHLRTLHDNVTAGVALIEILRDQADTRHAIAGYYQGLAGVRRYGMYPSTKQYVANVLALRKRIAHGWNPA